MREVNVSSPSRNQAASTITHALYDRRALDCTSTLPLVNSLNSLAYLTQSSARIRDILTRDGGLERLVTMLKRGKCRTPHEYLKWLYALQCVVNVGVRGADAKSLDSSGSETIRTRVVEADIVPVLATLLQNYLHGNEKLREAEKSKEEAEKARAAESEHASNGMSTRRHAPHHLLLPGIMPHTTEETADDPNTTPNINTPADRLFLPHRPNRQFERGTHQSRPQGSTHQTHHHHHHSLSNPTLRPRAIQVNRDIASVGPHNVFNLPSPTTAYQQSIRPQVVLSSREAIPPPLTAGLRQEDATMSHPQSPTTPTGPQPPGRGILRPMQVEASASGDSDEGETNAGSTDESENNTRILTGDVDVSMDLDVAEEQRNTTEVVEASQNLPVDGSDDEYNATLSIRHRSVDGRLMDPTEPLDGPNGNMPTAAGLPENSFAAVPSPVPLRPELTEHAAMQGSNLPGPLKWTPGAEHIVLSLQLLAYVSKYCQLRDYFQKTHFVPALQPEALRKRPADATDEQVLDLDYWDDIEYTVTNDQNIFPLVEKFTVRSYSQDMKYWACVVMRNLCRKDKQRGDVRQCAYYKCGRWETFARQFAKCRRCRQTKYCSKDCQKSAWVFHRHWCEPAKESKEHHHRHGHAGSSSGGPISSAVPGAAELP